MFFDISKSAQLFEPQLNSRQMIALNSPLFQFQKPVSHVVLVEFPNEMSCYYFAPAVLANVPNSA